MMLSQYLPILVFIIIGLVLGLVMLGAGSLCSVRKPDAEKNSPYECGFAAFENAHIPFDVRFYLVAKIDSENAQMLSILYGGSVNENNAHALFAMPDVDGGLIGGASLNARQFVEIVKCINCS